MSGSNIRVAFRIVLSLDIDPDLHRRNYGRFGGYFPLEYVLRKFPNSALSLTGPSKKVGMSETGAEVVTSSVHV